MDNIILSKTPSISLQNEHDSNLINERGLLYGDGFFSTIKITNGKVHRWPLHLERLCFSAERLGFIGLDAGWIYQQILDYIQQKVIVNGMLRMTITRGENPDGHRGYAIPDQQNLDYRLYLKGSNLQSSNDLEQGVTLGRSKVPVSRNKYFAGVKHLNRLDQVLASSRIKDACFDDLMFCGQKMICGTKTNVYFYVNGLWLTPKVNKAGVNGTVRRWLLDTQSNVRESQFGLEILKRAEYCLVSNAIIGIIPVTSIQLGAKKHNFEVYPNLKKLQQEYEEV